MARTVDGLAYAAVGTSDVERALVLYRDAMGGAVIDDAQLEGPAVERLYDLPAGSRVRRVTIAFTDGEHGRVQLLDFGAAAGGLALEGEQPADFGCSKTLDFFVEDYPEAERRLLASGATWEAEPREYTDGPYTSVEGILRAPDGARLAILHIVGEPRSIFAQGTGLFSELGASSHIVGALEPAVRFFREGFGYAVHLDTPLSVPEVDTLVGLPIGTGMHLTILAPDGLNTGKVAVVKYGVDTGRDFSGRVRPPQRGILAHGFQAAHLDSLLPRLESLGATIEVAPQELELGPWGRSRIAALTAPSGVRIELFERA